MRLVTLPFFYGPAIALAVAGLAAGRRHHRPPWRTAGVLAAISTAAWLLYVGLYQHETPCEGFPDRCPTVYGTSAPLPDEHAAGIVLLLAAFLVPAAVAGWHRLAPAATVGAALTIGPTALAMWTAPRGDNDGLWALIFWMLAGLGVLAAAVSGGAGQIRRARESPDDAASEPGRRLTAFGIDLVVVLVVLLGPLTLLSDAGHEAVATVGGLVAATTYLAVPVARTGASLGQSLLRLQVLDDATGARLSIARATARSGIIVVEVVLTFVLVGLPVLAEVVSMSDAGRSIADRLVRTTVTPRALMTSRP